MKKMIGLAMIGALCWLGSGCSTVDATSKYNGMHPTLDANTAPVAHLNSRINGVFLFGFIPLFSGAVNKPDYTAIFTNTTTVDNAFFQMMIQARQKGANAVINVNSSVDSSMILPIFLYMRSVEVSGTAVIQNAAPSPMPLGY